MKIDLSDGYAAYIADDGGVRIEDTRTGEAGVWTGKLADLAYILIKAQDAGIKIMVPIDLSQWRGVYAE